MLIIDADIPRAMNLRSPDSSPTPSFASEEIPLFIPELEDNPQGQTPAAQAAQKKGPLQEETKLQLIRYVSGEFAKATQALPGGKDGYFQYVDKPLNPEILQRAVATHGAAIHAGEQCQITKLEFRAHMIVVDVNGGGRGKRGRLLDHIQIGMGGNTSPMPQSTATRQDETGPPGLQPGAGSTLFLEFNKTVPDLAPEELKKILSPFLDFTRQRSATVQWADTLPPDIKKAIQDRKPKLGMDREMVIAAIGKPGHKVRERDQEGNDIEDWIYGTPPDRTVFVRFTGDKVSSIKQFPQ